MLARNMALAMASAGFGNNSHEQIANRLNKSDLISKVTEKNFIPMSRIDQCVPQMINQRAQLMSVDGAFVLTEINKLPPGGNIQSKAFSEESLGLFILGDMGALGSHQTEVVKQVKTCIDKISEDQLPMVIGVGDWVYPRGPKSLVESERQRTITSVLSAYRPLSKSCNVMGILGNHEYGDHEGPADPGSFIGLAQEYGIDMPSRYYVQSLNGNTFDLHIIALDSTTLVGDEEQVKWCEQIVNGLHHKKMISSKPQWTILATHQPFESYGHHSGETLFLKDVLKNILPRIDICVSGHEHDLEYIVRDGTIPPQVVSGTSSSLRTSGGSNKGKLNISTPGYAKLIANKSELRIEFHSVDVPNRKAGELLMYDVLPSAPI